MKNLLKTAIAFTLGALLTVWILNLKSSNIVSEKMFVESDANYLKTELVINTKSELDSDSDKFDSTLVVIDNDYTRMILNAFVEDAVAHGLDYNEVVEHIKALDIIMVRDMSDLGTMDADSNQVELLGLTLAKLDPDSSGRIRGAILMNIKLLDDLDLYAFTLYHELGHWFGLEHCGCDDRIMMNTQNDADVDLAFIKWEQTIRIFMNKIEAGFDHENCHYDFPDVKLANVE